jgi:hypothetical protein
MTGACVCGCARVPACVGACGCISALTETAFWPTLSQSVHILCADCVLLYRQDDVRVSEAAKPWSVDLDASIGRSLTPVLDFLKEVVLNCTEAKKRRQAHQRYVDDG